MDLNLLTSPRVILMAFYPGSFYPEGHIYQCKTQTIRTQYQPIEWYRKYPKVFRELTWYEFRKEEEMPEYLKTYGLSKEEIIIKVSKYYLELNYALAEDKWTAAYLSNSVPSTKEDYESYLELSKNSL